MKESGQITATTWEVYSGLMTVKGSVHKKGCYAILVVLRISQEDHGLADKVLASRAA